MNSIGLSLSACSSYAYPDVVRPAAPRFGYRGRAGLHNLLTRNRYHPNKKTVPGWMRLALLATLIAGWARDGFSMPVLNIGWQTDEPGRPGQVVPPPAEDSPWLRMQATPTAMAGGVWPALSLPAAMGAATTLAPVLPFQEYPYHPALPIQEHHFNQLKDISRELNVDPLWMLAIFLHETAYNPAVDGPYFDANKANPFGCKGAIQWCAEGDRWKGDLPLEEQLPWIADWFRTHTYATPLNAIDYYLIIFTPAYINETEAIGSAYSPDSTRQAVYDSNSGADLNGDGHIMAIELQRLIGQRYDALTALYR